MEQPPFWLMVEQGWGVMREGRRRKRRRGRERERDGEVMVLVFGAMVFIGSLSILVPTCWGGLYGIVPTFGDSDGVLRLVWGEVSEWVSVFEIYC